MGDNEMSCIHEECPYQACIWHKYSTDDVERKEYCDEYHSVSMLFPMDIEDMKICNMYLDQ